MELNIRIAGEAGQGVETTGSVLVGALAAVGLHVFSTQTYMSRIRGGLNWFDIRISDHELFSRSEQTDLLVAFTPKAVETLRPTVAKTGLVLSETDAASSVVQLPFRKAAVEAGGSQIMANAVAAGAVFAVLGCALDALTDHLGLVLKKKGADVVEKNAACARRGAELAHAQAGALKAPAGVGAPGSVYSGAEAIGLGAATAGVKFATAYPMSPSTAVFTYLAGVADEYGIVVEQAEDEIAAVNMSCGATYAGVPAIVTTSGGGFALMTEGLSLAGMLELPILIMIAQRPGPATGLPTRTAQQDLRFALHAGHGEFPRAIFAPGTPAQAYELTRRALEIAHKHQSPALLLADQFFLDHRKNVPALDTALRPIDRHIVEGPSAEYLRYAVTPNGVSPRALPGGDGLVVLDSDEHDAEGHITEDLGVRVVQQDKRMAKLRGLTADVVAPERYGAERPEHLLVCWGSTYGPCREAVDTLNAGGAAVAMLHFGQVWPLDAPAVRTFIRSTGAKSVTCVEGNATGQLASMLREAGVLDDCELILRYDGLPFAGGEIAARMRR